MIDSHTIGQHTVLIKRRKGQRHLRIRINSDGQTVLSIPKRYPKELAIQFLRTKIDWVKKHSFSKKIIEQNSVLYSGQKVEIMSESHSRNKTTYTRGVIRFYLSKELEDPDSQAYMTKKIQKIYTENMTDIIKKRLDYYKPLTGLTYRGLAIKNLRSKWGSCDKNKQLKFSLYLIGCTDELIDYVVLHELAHTKHMNHSPDFWKLCSIHMPDYKKRRAELKMQTMSLAN